MSTNKKGLKIDRHYDLSTCSQCPFSMASKMNRKIYGVHRFLFVYRKKATFYEGKTWPKNLLCVFI